MRYEVLIWSTGLGLEFGMILEYPLGLLFGCNLSVASLGGTKNMAIGGLPGLEYLPGAGHDFGKILQRL